MQRHLSIISFFLAALRSASVVALIPTNTTAPAYYPTVDGHNGDKVGCPDGFIFGVCTSGRHKDCVVEKDAAFDISMLTMDVIAAIPDPPEFLQKVNVYQSAVCSGVKIQRTHKRIAGGIGHNWGKLQRCPHGKVAYYRCNTVGRKRCVVNGKRYKNGIWCRTPPSLVRIGNHHKYLCGRYGKQVKCPPGYAVTGICAGGGYGDCNFGTCRGKKKIFTQIRCSNLLPNW